MTRNYTILRNARSCTESTVPVLDISEWRNSIIETCKNAGGRIVSIFGSRIDANKVRLFAVIGIDSKGELRVSSANVDGGSYPSITPELNQAHLFERELFENFGIVPKDHPWLKPVRKSKGYDYFSITGDSIHEVAVGPVHAGVIEPGHFRFQCHGEKVFNLEIHLGYEHRGIEKTFPSSSPARRMIIAESIAGDSVIAHGLAYCHAIEALAEREVTQRARIIRAIALELERVANHVGDLGAIANDVGFLPSASYFGRLRAVFLNLLMDLSGNRFGRSLLKPGGVTFDLTPDMADDFKVKLEKAFAEVTETADLMFSNPAVVARLERTGVVTQETAKDIGLVGPSARACGLQRDVRCDYPTGMYRFNKMIMAKANTGDVFARARIRSIEIKRSLELINELLDKIPLEKIYFPVETMNKSSFAISMVEGWRGETVHIARTDENGNIFQYKIVDPSFHNWTGLEMALRDGQISDFPLCNKSFNLSYAGYDL